MLRGQVRSTWLIQSNESIGNRWKFKAIQNEMKPNVLQSPNYPFRIKAVLAKVFSFFID